MPLDWRYQKALVYNLVRQKRGPWTKVQTYMEQAHKDSSIPRNPYACKKSLQSTSRSVLMFLGFLSRSPCSGSSKHRLRAGSTSVYRMLT